MNFKEWLLLSEQPAWQLPRQTTVYLPDQMREPVAVTFDVIDFRVEDQWKRPENNRQFDQSPEGQANQKQYWMTVFQRGFRGKLPFGNDYLTYNCMTRTGSIGPSQDDTLPEAPRDWWAWACFILGDDIVYWKSNGVTQPAMKQTA